MFRHTFHFHVFHFSFACSFYILTLTGSGSLFGTYLDAIAMIETLALPLIGTFIDRVAHKRLLMIGQSISTSILLLFAFTENIPMLFITMIVLVFVDMIVSSIVSSNLQLISGKYLEKLISYRQVVTSASGILSPILAGLLVAILSIQNIALINSVTDFYVYYCCHSSHLKMQALCNSNKLSFKILRPVSNTLHVSII